MPMNEGELDIRGRTFRIIRSERAIVDKTGATCAVLWDDNEQTITIDRLAPVGAIARGVASGVARRMMIPVIGLSESKAS